MNNYQTETSLLDKYIRSSRAVDPHSLYADPDPEPAVFLNADPDPGPAQQNHKSFLKLEKKQKDYSKVENKGACKIFTLKTLNKVAVISNFRHIFSFK